jgi:hypothetical protein
MASVGEALLHAADMRNKQLPHTGWLVTNVSAGPG